MFVRALTCRIILLQLSVQVTVVFTSLSPIQQEDLERAVLIGLYF
jgi:hypothetical protein